MKFVSSEKLGFRLTPSFFSFVSPGRIMVPKGSRLGPVAIGRSPMAGPSSIRPRANDVASRVRLRPGRGGRAIGSGRSADRYWPGSRGRSRRGISARPGVASGDRPSRDEGPARLLATPWVWIEASRRGDVQGERSGVRPPSRDDASLPPYPGWPGGSPSRLAPFRSDAEAAAESGEGASRPAQTCKAGPRWSP